ncbi:MAG: TldD/PmbA family protein [Clostridiaceae bacterium]|nr:TldD/PmbA family protein [Clostridiaceae bacterium]
MEFQSFKDKLFKKAINNGFDECEIYYVNRDSLSIKIYEGQVDSYNLNKTFGLSFRGKVNNKMGYSYTEVMDESAIDMLVKNAKAGALSIESNDVQFIYEGDKEYKEVKSYSEALENINPEKIIELALNIEGETKGYSSKVISVPYCAISYGNSNYGIYNTKGLELTNKANLLTAYAGAVVEDGGRKYDGMGYICANSLDEVDPKKIAKQAVEEALAKINAKQVKSNTYKVIIKNEAMSSLLGTFSGIFNSDAAQKGLSLLKDKEGEKIASDIVTIIDDPLLEDGLASTPFDDEGVASYKKEIVSKGVLNTLLYNLKTANKAGKKSTGNGFKASYASQVGVSPSNFYIEKGKNSIEDLYKFVGEGIMITDLDGLHAGANSITGDFSLATKGFYIKDGKKSFPIEQITVAGNYFELLKSIEMVGDDLKFPLSSIGSPSVVIKGLSIAGK